jgi:hypothetical protein
MSEEMNEIEDVPYQRGIGSLMYAATSTRPDIADNPNTTQALGYTKDKYNAKIRKRRVSPKVPPTTYKGQRIK